MIIQLTGLSGSGKTTLANRMKFLFSHQSTKIEVIDGDEYRKTLCSDLGFSKEDRFENIRRLGKLAAELMSDQCFPIISAINPFEILRLELKNNYGASTVWIKCAVDTLIHRDTKGLYKRALLPNDHPDKLHNLTGINDVYELPAAPDLIIDTSVDTIDQSAEKLYRFILALNPARNAERFQRMI